MKNKIISPTAHIFNKIKHLPPDKFQEELQMYIRIIKLNLLLIYDLNKGRKHGNN